MYIDDELEDEMEIETENEEGESEEENTEPEVENEVPELPVAVQIVQAALQGDAVGVKEIFKAALGDRVADIVADRKQAIANSLITPDQEQPEIEPEEGENEETETDNPANNVPSTESE